MDYIKLFAKKKKRKGIWDFDTNNKNKLPGYSNGIWHRKMCLTYNEKLEKTNDGRNKAAKPRKNQTVWREKNYKYFGSIENGHDQTSGEDKKKGRV